LPLVNGIIFIKDIIGENMKNLLKVTLVACTLNLAYVSLALADPSQPVIINNNNSQPQASSQPSCAPANQNNIYDSRVPPAGAYYTRNADGSGQQVFTTGEKKPYIVDNNCGGGMSNAAQPQVIVTPSVRR
jgi:hypothetical protein